MKTILLLLLLCISCKEDDTLMGCSTGVRNGSRELIRCATKQQHLAGNNISAGGVKHFTAFTNTKWEKCDQCK